MRILFQSDAFLPRVVGGVEVFLYHLIRELQARGHEALVATSRVGSEPVGRQSYAGIDLVKLDFGNAMAARDLAAMQKVSVEVSKLVAEFKPAVLHLNDVRVSSFLFLRGGATGSLPRLLTLHAPLLPAGTGGLRSRLASDSDRIVAVSKAIHDDAIAAMPETAGKLAVILNALPMPLAAPTELPFAPPLLLGIGRLAPEKGFDVALRALALRHAKNATVDLAIAGNGPQKASLEALAESLGIAGQVRFLDWVPPDAVPALMNTATAVLMPSIWPEPFGLVALQAAQMGRPVLASAVGGLPEIVEAGRTGLLIAPNDPRAWAEAIGVFLDDAAAARAMGRNARQRAEAMFDFGRLVDAYEAVYTELAGVG